MASLQRLAAVALLSALCVLLASGASAQGNASEPSVLFHDPNTAVTFRQYSGCAVNIHQIGVYSATPTMMAFGGVDAGYNFLSSYDMTVAGNWDFGFTAAAASSTFNNISGYSGCNPLGRVAPGAGWLYNGPNSYTLVIMGGKACPNWTPSNDVIYSTNSAASFSQAVLTAPWAARSDFSVSVQLNTTVMVLTGGSLASGAMLNGQS